MPLGGNRGSTIGAKVLRSIVEHVRNGDVSYRLQAEILDRQRIGDGVAAVGQNNRSAGNLADTKTGRRHAGEIMAQTIDRVRCNDVVDTSGAADNGSVCSRSGNRPARCKMLLGDGVVVDAIPARRQISKIVGAVCSGQNVAGNVGVVMGGPAFQIDPYPSNSRIVCSLDAIVIEIAINRAADGATLNRGHAARADIVGRILFE